ncbi:MAG: ArnT family glycosyltransferase [Anaerolineales bacterium]
MVLGLLNALAFLLLIPPWEHYDEPTHFEYAWLIAHSPGLPSTGAYDQAMRREVAISMIETGFFEERDIEVNLTSPDEPVWIGISQLDDPPTYYWLAALPLRVLANADIRLQLYAARLVSLVLYLATIWAAWGITRELAPPKSSLRLMIPAAVALLPGLADIMTSVNNDVGATAALSFFLWGSVRAIRRGLSLGNLVWLVVSAAASAVTKNTAALGLVSLPAVLVFAVLRTRSGMLRWGIVFVAYLGLGILIFEWGDAARWYRLGGQSASTRAAVEDSRLGDFALQVEASQASSRPSLVQALLPDEDQNLRGKLVSLGAWIWSTEDTVIRPPKLRGANLIERGPIEIKTEPSFQVWTFRVPDSGRYLWIKLDPGGVESAGPATIYYDGLVLAEGARPSDSPPIFSDAGGTSGSWGGRGFDNYVRNASGEVAWPRLRPWSARLLEGIVPGNPDVTFGALFDWRLLKGYYLFSAGNLFRTYWAKFSWGQVSLLGERPYRTLLVATGFGLVGAAAAVLTRRRRLERLPWEVMGILAISTAAVWGAALVRGVSWRPENLFIPASRYAYPVVIPTMLVLTIGWYWWMRRFEHVFRLPARIKWVVFFGLLLILDVWSLVSIYVFFSSRGGG